MLNGAKLMNDEVMNIDWSNLSLCDSGSRVFIHNNKIYRAILKPDLQLLTILKEPFFIELVEKELFPSTKLSTTKFKGFEYVLEHETADYILYPHEWSFDMLKVASILYLKVASIALKYGYVLKDGHPFNIVFFGKYPKFVDIGSFEKGTEQNLYEFNRTMFIPLLIWSKGSYLTALNFFVIPI